MKTLLFLISITGILSCTDSKEKGAAHQAAVDSLSSVPYFKSKTVFLLKDQAFTAETYSPFPPSNGTDTLRVPYSYFLTEGQTVSLPIYTLIIPMAKQYRINLPGEGQLWFNAGTVLDLMVKQAATTRLLPVQLFSGEMFIRLGDQDSLNLQTDHITVKAAAGSSLNIKNYADESSEAVTVTDGKAMVRTAREEKKLEEGTEVLLSKKEKILKTHAFDPELAASWITGWIRTNNMGDLFRQLGRWFDRQIIYQGVDPEAVKGVLNFNVKNFKLHAYCKVLTEGFQIECTESADKIYVYKSVQSQ